MRGAAMKAIMNTEVAVNNNPSEYYPPIEIDSTAARSRGKL
jgi:hypothetical protein